MNQKELGLTILILIGLVLTATSLSREGCYDCNQPVFSNASSCSDFGGSCIDIHVKSGFGGLVNYISGIEVKDDGEGVMFSCPSCSFKFRNSSLEKVDSVNYVRP